MKYLLSFMIVCFFFSCQKKDFELDLPESVEFGKSEVYLNGELREDYIKSNFVLQDGGEGISRVTVKFNSVLSAGKSFEFAIVAIGGFPPQEGTFELVDDFRLYDNRGTPKFAFSIGQHGTKEKYDEIFLDDGFIEIIKIDITNQIVEGRFKCNFKRVKKQIKFPTGYPKFLEFQGVFHDSLTVQ